MSLAPILALSILGQATAPPRLAELSTTMAVADIGREIERVAGQKVEVEASIADRIVTVRVKDRTAHETLQMIAAAIDGKVEEKEDKLILLSDPERESAAAARTRGEVEAAIKTYFEKAEKIARADYTEKAVADYIRGESVAIETGKEDVQSFLGSRPGSSGSPAGRSAAIALTAIPADQLASVRLGHRVVYSTAPTKMQRPWPVEPKAFLASFQADLAVAATGLELAGPEARDMIRGEFTLPDSAAKSVEARLVVSHSSLFSFGALTADLTFLDGSGNMTASHQAMLWVSPVLNTAFSGLDSMAGTEVIELSEASKSYMTSAREAETGEGRPADRPETIRRPDIHEPLSMVPTDYVRQIYARDGRDIVAELPDAAVFLMFMAEPGAKVNLDRLRRIVMDTLFHVVSESDDAIILTAREAESARAIRPSRAAMARLLGRSPKPGPVALEPLAEYFAARDCLPYLSAVEYAVFGSNRVDLPTAGLVSDAVSHYGLEFLGRLPLPQRQALTAGQRLPYKTQTIDQKRRLEAMVFSAHFDTPLRYMPTGPEGTAGFTPREPTDLLPNGMPEDAYVQLVRTEVPLLYTLDRDGKTWGAIEVEDLASLIAQRRLAPPDQKSEYVEPPKRFRLGRKTDYGFKLFVRSDAYAGFETTEDSEPSDEKEYRMDELPADLRKAIDAAVARAIEDLKSMPKDDGVK